MRTSAVALLVLMSAALSSRAEVTISLPAEGYYRPGRFFPVRIGGQGRAGAIEVGAGGAMGARIEGLRGPAIVPLLAVTASVRQLRWVSDDGAEHAVAGELHALADQEAMIGVAGGDVESAKALFPRKSLIVLPLDSAGQLLSPASAWEVLDGLLLGAPAAAQLDDGQIQTLLAAGTVIVVHSANPPGGRWPWKRMGENWVLRLEPAGSAPALDGDVYGPTYSWDAGWPRAFRLELLGGACVFCILALAVSLWRSRYAVIGIVVLTAAGIGLLGVVYRLQSPVRTQRLGVAIRTPGLIQYDLWSWQSSMRETLVSLPAAAPAHPIFGSLSQLQELEPRMICRSDGQPERFVFRLKPGESLAMLTRIVRPFVNLSIQQPVDPRWNAFIRDHYLRSTDQIEGQTVVQDPSSAESISTVVIDRR
ncbi:MAG TPA: hypothetical protein VK797_27320 [Tepidisphaeraceae bacterium]|nr:hypothetical protein [Tepidisphaeraceae bacterium]